MGFTADFRLDDTSLFHSDQIDEPLAWSGTSNPEIDRLLEVLSASLDREEALSLWAEYQQAIMAEQPYTYFYFPDRLDGVNGGVKGVVMDVRGDWLNIREWYLDPSG